MLWGGTTGSAWPSPVRWARVKRQADAFGLISRFAPLLEPTGGSDTANISTSAVLTDDGKHYIVNGTKKVRSWERQGL